MKNKTFRLAWLFLLTAICYIATASADTVSSYDSGAPLTGTDLFSFSRSGAGTKKITGAQVATYVISTDVELAALGGLTSATDRVPYFTGSGTAALATFGSVGRTLVAQTTQALMRTTGLGSTTVGDAVFIAANSAAARTAIGAVIGTDVQAYDADLTTYAGITPGAGVTTFLATGILPITGGGTGAVNEQQAKQNVGYLVYASTYHAAGDSITTGATATTPTTEGYPYVFATDTGTTLTNRAVSGALACDIADAQTLTYEDPVQFANPYYTVLEGTNDANTKGVGTYENNYNNCQRAQLAWLAISNTYKVKGQAAGCVTSGTWTNDSSWGGSIAKYSQTNGSTLTCTITSFGGTIYAWYRQADSTGGTFTYKLDSGSTTSVPTSPTPAIATQNGGVNGVGLIRITGASAGSHTVTFAITSSTSASNPVVIGGVGTVPPLSLWKRPSVFVGGVVKQQSDANSAATAAYDADTLANVNLLHDTDGLPVYFVNVRAYVNSSTDMANSLHPNTTGHRHLADAFEQAIQPSMVPGTGSSLLSQGPAAFAGVTNYVRSNSANTLSTTDLNAGYLVYSNAATADSFGLDLGSGAAVGAGYSTRLFAPANEAVALSTFAHTGTNPTAQSQFTDNLLAFPAQALGYGAVQVALPGTGSEVGIQLRNSGTGGRKYDIYSTATASGLGGGNFVIADATAGASRLQINSGGGTTLSPLQTIASATSAVLDDFNLPAATTTVTGTTAITTAKGFNKVSIYKPTITDASAVTITNAASLYVEGAPLAAGSAIITNAYALWVAAGDLLLGATKTTTGSVRYVNNGSSSWFGIYDGGTSLSYGLAVALPAPAGVSALGGYYSGLGVGGSSASSVNTPAFGVLASDQSGTGLGNVDFTVYANKKVYTFNNTLDDGSGGMIATGLVKAPGFQSTGTKFTTSGCSISSTTGGATAGVFTLGAASCTAVVTMGGGMTSTNGWTCQAKDKTAIATIIDGESTSTTTTASFVIPVTAGATDVISWSCVGY